MACNTVRPRLPHILLAAFTFGLICQSELQSAAESSNAQHVGQAGPNVYLTPANQILTPAGIQVDLPGLRPQALALSPNGQILVTAGKTRELIVVDPRSGKIRQRVPLPSEKTEAQPGQVSENILEADKEAQLSYTG